MDLWNKYLNKLGDPKKSTVVVAVLKKAMKYAPGSEMALPYGVPGLKFKGKNLIAAAAHKGHLGIYPFSPNVVKLIIPKLKTSSFSKGTIRFDFENLPQDKIIKELVALRKKEIEKPSSKVLKK